MAMIDDLIEHHREMIARLEEDIASFEAGSMTTSTLRDGQRVDTTADWIAELRRRNGALKRIVVEHEAQREMRNDALKRIVVAHEAQREI